MRRDFLFLSGLLGATGVVAGALGAHSLTHRLSAEDLRAFEVGAHYQLLHAVALGVIAVAAGRGTSRWLGAAGWLVFFGVVAFSGSLYVLSLGGPGWVGPVTPAGGSLLIVGWAALAVGALRTGSRSGSGRSDPPA